MNFHLISSRTGPNNEGEKTCTKCGCDVFSDLGQPLPEMIGPGGFLLYSTDEQTYEDCGSLYPGLTKCTP